MDRIGLHPQYTWRGARQLGVTRRQIAADGVALARGVYVSRSVDSDLLSRCRAWALVLPEDAAFSHVTAGELLGAPVAPSAVPPSRSPRAESFRSGPVWSCTVAGCNGRT